LMKENLQDAQVRMKLYADKHRTPQELEIGDWVNLRLRTFRQMSVSLRQNLKLSPRYYGPFQITQKIGKVAYKLDRPPNAQIYPMFHVSLLKKQLGTRTIPFATLPTLTPEGTLTPKPEKIFIRRLLKKGNRARCRSAHLMGWSNRGGCDMGGPQNFSGEIPGPCGQGPLMEKAVLCTLLY